MICNGEKNKQKEEADKRKIKKSADKSVEITNESKKIHDVPRQKVLKQPISLRLRQRDEVRIEAFKKLLIESGIDEEFLTRTVVFRLLLMVGERAPKSLVSKIAKNF